ncbi:MAG: glutamate racemase [Eubacteriales bacterium]|jgi:glutamate racemase
MNRKSIGVFDSGLGGLTAVRELKRCLPHENIIYFGDTGRVPYGTRGFQTIIKYARQDIHFLSTFPIKAILIACGTASSIALPALEPELQLPTLGVIGTTVDYALRATRTHRIGVIGTQGTISSGAYERELKRLDPQAQIVSNACPLFVPLVENGRCKLGDPVPRLVAEEYLAPIQEFGVDTLILGCTHYPLLREVIGQIMGSEVTLIDAGYAGSHSLKRYLTQHEMLSQRQEPGSVSYYVSDDVAGFSQLASVFLGEQVEDTDVQKIDIERY